jgi:hypothetical protein
VDELEPGQKASGGGEGEDDAGEEEGGLHIPSCDCASCLLGGICMKQMSPKELKKFEKQQASA